MFKVKLLIFGGQLEQKQVTAFPKQSFLMTLIKTVCWATTYIFLAQKLFIVSYYIRSLRVRISNVHLFFSCFVNVGKKITLHTAPFPISKMAYVKKLKKIKWLNFGRYYGDG